MLSCRRTDRGTPDLNELGLRLLHYEQPTADPVTDWYNRQTAANADTLLAEAAALFEKNPMLGALSPSLPLWQGCTAARRAAWMREKDALAQEVSVPVGSDPPPAQLRLGACAGVCLPDASPPAQASVTPGSWP